MAVSYTPIQTFEAKQLSVDLLNTPKDFYQHNRRYSASLIMQLIYGHRIPTCLFLIPLLVRVLMPSLILIPFP